MSEESYDECIVCGEPLKTHILLPCNHSNFCIKCYERLSLCYNERKCPFCQKEVTRDPIISKHKLLDKYDDEMKKNKKQHENFYHVFFEDKDDLREVLNLRRIICQDCGKQFSTFGQLKNHAAKEHKKQVCQICFESKRFLKCDCPLYTKEMYRAHLKQHPKCPVCSFVGFDDNILNVHKRENHFKCDICEQQGKESWFGSLELIEVHFHTEHFACEDPMCVMQGFIVFATEEELLKHRVEVHGADPSILKPIKDDNSPIDVRDEDNIQKRHSVSKKMFKAATKREFANEPKKSFDLENIVYQVDHRKMSVEDFCKQYKEITGESANKLFVETIAIVFNPTIRAEVVKGLQGIRSCSIPRFHSTSSTASVSEEKEKEPLVEKPAKPYKPRNRGKPKKPKKIVLANI